MADLSVQTYTFFLNYLFQLSKTVSTQSVLARVCRILTELFLPTSPDDDDDGSAWFTPPAGVEVEEVKVSGFDRSTALEGLNVGQGIVSLDVRLHSFGKAPMDALGTALVAYIKSHRADFGPDLSLVAHDDYWEQNIATIAAKLPAVIVQLDSAPFESPR